MTAVKDRGELVFTCFCGESVDSAVAVKIQAEWNDGQWRLIPTESPNSPTGMYDGASRERIAAFKAVLDAARLPATVRLTRGRDIAAACGQLAAEAA